MARTSIGLDIGTRAVRLAEITTGGNPQLTRFGRMLLPIGAVDHGEIHDPQAVTNAITTLWRRLGLTGRAVHVGVANRRVVVRVIELPAMEKADLAGAIRFQAQEHIPIPLDQAVMDFEVLDDIETPEGEKTQRVLVVAAERATIEPLLAAIQGAKLDLASLELNAYPLVRCFGGPHVASEAIVDIGAGVTNVVIHSEGKIRFTRILPTFGGEEFTQAVATGLGVERDEAEILKRRASALLGRRSLETAGAQRAGATYASAVGDDVVAGPSGSPSTGQFGGSRNAPGVPMNQPMGMNTPELNHAAQIIEPMLDRFTTEVRGSLDFYASQAGARSVERVVLTGGGSLLGGLEQRLQTALQLTVEQGHPFARVPIGKIDVSPEERAIAEPFLGVAVGLALAGAK